MVGALVSQALQPPLEKQYWAVSPDVVSKHLIALKAPLLSCAGPCRGSSCQGWRGISSRLAEQRRRFLLCLPQSQGQFALTLASLSWSCSAFPMHADCMCFKHASELTHLILNIMLKLEHGMDSIPCRYSNGVGVQDQTGHEHAECTAFLLSDVVHRISGCVLQRTMLTNLLTILLQPANSTATAGKWMANAASSFRKHIKAQAQHNRLVRLALQWQIRN